MIHLLLLTGATGASSSASIEKMSVGGVAAGELRQAANFSFLRVYDAGHMVPRDQPERSLAMLNAFISDTL